MTSDERDSGMRLEVRVDCDPGPAVDGVRKHGRRPLWNAGSERPGRLLRGIVRGLQRERERQLGRLEWERERKFRRFERGLEW
jgi:hypothetical protein